MTDSFGDALRKFSKKVESLTNPGTIPFGELFSPDFMARHTRSANINAFFETGGFNLSSQKELEELDEAELDAHVRAHSKFKSWGEMKVAAYEEWAKRKMR